MLFNIFCHIVVSSNSECFFVFFIFLKRSIAEPGDLSQFDFLSFAQANFQNGQVFRFTRAPLLEPLLNSENKEDHMVRIPTIYLLAG